MDLIFEAMFFSAVLLDLGIDVLHKGVPLHQHVSEGGAGEDSHHLLTISSHVRKDTVSWDFEGLFLTLSIV
jgi:hypothetical protein